MGSSVTPALLIGQGPSSKPLENRHLEAFRAQGVTVCTCNRGYVRWCPGLVDRTYVHDAPVLQRVIKDPYRPPRICTRRSAYQQVMNASPPQVDPEAASSLIVPLGDAQGCAGIVAVADVVTWASLIYLIGFDGHADRGNELDGVLPEYASTIHDGYLSWDKQIQSHLAAADLRIVMMGKTGAFECPHALNEERLRFVCLEACASGPIWSDV